MPNFLEKIIDFLTAVILMFLIPVLYFNIKTDSIIQVDADKKTTDFVKTVSSHGYLTRDMYEKYLSDLSDTGELYSIELTHEKTAFAPEYKLRSATEIIGEDEELWDGNNEYTEREVITDFPVVEDPIVEGNVNEETNESVLESAEDTPAPPTHVHSGACYFGSKHVHSGSPASGGGCYGGGGSTEKCTNHLVYHYSENQEWTSYCSICWGTVMFIRHSDIYYCGRHYPQYTTLWYRRCLNCGDTYTSIDNRRFDGTECGVEYTRGYTLNCGKTEGHYYDGNTEVFPECSMIPVSITPTHPIQTVYTGDPFITAVIVTYLDGSTRTVIGTSDYSAIAPVQGRQVIIYYTVTVGSRVIAKSCTITLTVIPKTETCNNGHVYNRKPDGTDPGCPYCRAWLASLSVFVPASIKLTMYRNSEGSLEAEGVGLLAVYLDGHTEHVYSGYSDNLDPDYVGIQTVTIGYKGLVTYLEVHVVRNRKLCDVCGLYYNLLIDDTDPGCPYCRAKVPVFTGHIMKYTSETYREELVAKLYEGNGTYFFRRGDRLMVKLESRKKPGHIASIGRLFSLPITVVHSETVKDEQEHR